MSRIILQLYVWNESCCSSDWVCHTGKLSKISRQYVPLLFEADVIADVHEAHLNCESVMSHMGMGCSITYVNASRHTREWVMSRMWMRYVTKCELLESPASQFLHAGEKSSRLALFDKAPSHVWHDLFKYMTWLVHIFDTTHSALYAKMPKRVLLYAIGRHSWCNLHIYIYAYV